MTIEIMLAVLVAAAVNAAPGPGPAAGASRVFDVRGFGARGDGRTMDTVALQSAINAAAAAGGGVVALTNGDFLTGSLWLKSHVELRIAPDARLLGSTSLADYQRNRWAALLLAEGQQDIAITGGGTIDGRGRELVKDVIRRMNAGEGIGHHHPTGRPDENDRPQVIEFRNCHGVTVSGVTLRDSACWLENYINCEDVSLKDIQVRNTAYWNNDGMDISDCRRVSIVHCDINAADDGICLKSERGGKGCYDVSIEDCRVRSSASALKLGTASFGGFRKIRVKNLTVYDTFRSAIALESVDGGVLDDVVVEHVRATNTGNAIFMRLGHRATNAPVGRLSNVVIRDVKVEVPAGKPDAGYETEGPPAKAAHNIFPASLAGLPGFPVSNITLDDIEIIYPGGASRLLVDAAIGKVPEQPEKYPEISMFGELPAWGFYLRHAENIRFNNVRMRTKTGDARAAVVLDDVNQVDLDNLSIQPGDASLVLQGANHLAINGTRCGDADRKVQLSENCAVNLLRVNPKE
ncbi:MAG: glycosyl hydrolase family 28 protein [Verrucomicrobiae bacterium]|nr:glycosyl hydrolase family 28 protein [Verrucomicrobiae bacterium]